MHVLSVAVLLFSQQDGYTRLIVQTTWPGYQGFAQAPPQPTPSWLHDKYVADTT